MKRALILSDGKPGHANQSVALCQDIGMAHETIRVAYRNRLCKALSYLFDRLGIRMRGLYRGLDLPDERFDLVVSTGSATYYANKLAARALGVPNIAILHPKGYWLDFSLVVSPAYDHPPKRANILELPINLCASTSAYYEQMAEEFLQRHRRQKPAVGIVVGGPNAVSILEPDALRNQLEQIIRLTEGMERWITTSRRTPPEVEAMIETLPFDYRLINSRDAYNPVPAFVHLCERLFVTSDSTSMVSECVGHGNAKVEILMNRQLGSPNKFDEFIHALESRGAIHVFDGQLGHASEKIDSAPLLRAALARIIDIAD